MYLACSSGACSCWQKAQKLISKISKKPSVAYLVLIPFSWKNPSSSLLGWFGYPSCTKLFHATLHSVLLPYGSTPPSTAPRALQSLSLSMKTKLPALCQHLLQSEMIGPESQHRMPPPNHSALLISEGPTAPSNDIQATDNGPFVFVWKNDTALLQRKSVSLLAYLL